MDDFLAYLNGDHDDPCTQAAVVHGQFETIHPFGDGNGRIGRVLIARVLMRRCGLLHLPPPVSVLIARDAGGYISGLWQYREGSLDDWVRWFVSIVRRAAEATAETLDRLGGIRGRWAAVTSGVRADSAAVALLDALVGSPVVTSTIVAETLGVSTRTARNALATLEALGVVGPVNAPATPKPGRAPQWWAATEITTVIGEWAR